MDSSQQQQISSFQSTNMWKGSLLRMQQSLPDWPFEDGASCQGRHELTSSSITLERTSNVFQCFTTESRCASCDISLLIAKSGQPHAIGEGCAPSAIGGVLSTVLHKSSHDIIKTITLSNNSVQRGRGEVAGNAEDAMCSIWRSIEFAFQLAEPALPDTASLRLAYVHFIKGDSFSQELLFGGQLGTGTM